jgi:hypothetical protein
MNVLWGLFRECEQNALKLISMRKVTQALRSKMEIYASTYVSNWFGVDLVTTSRLMRIKYYRMSQFTFTFTKHLSRDFLMESFIFFIQDT